MPLPLPQNVWKIVKEVARHVLRRPVVGIIAAAQTADGRWLLIRRGDTGRWALPGGTLEWGETLRHAIERELREEAGAQVVELGPLLGAYSAPERDSRFHAVTIVVGVTVSPPDRPPDNDLEVTEVRLFPPEELPTNLSHGMDDVLDNAKKRSVIWE